MARTEHFNDPNAPVANNLVAAASAVVADEAGAILLIERADNDLWTIPGGGMEVGETIAIREVKEETGLDVAVQRLVGIYSDPVTSSSTPTERYVSNSQSASPAPSQVAGPRPAPSLAGSGSSRRGHRGSRS
jgi:ADP-ribose pyrophosphatase YjhB (NUDIX family)